MDFKTLATVAAISATPIQAQEQWKLALPEHIAWAINCIIEKWINNYGTTSTLDLWEVLWSIDFSPTWEQTLSLLYQGKAYEDVQDIWNWIIFDGIWNEVIMWEDVFEYSEQEYDLNHLIRYIADSCNIDDDIMALSELPNNKKA